MSVNIYQNGVLKTISSNTPAQEITRADYDALTESEKKNGTMYVIIDEFDQPDASVVNYDNGNSGLTSTKVQGAIDELAGSVDDINEDLDNVKSSLTKLEVKEAAISCSFNSSGQSLVVINSESQTINTINLLLAVRPDSNGYMLIPYTKQSSGGGLNYWYLKCIDQSFNPVAGTMTVYVYYTEV